MGRRNVGLVTDVSVFWSLSENDQNCPRQKFKMLLPMTGTGQVFDCGLTGSVENLFDFEEFDIFYRSNQKSSHFYREYFQHLAKQIYNNFICQQGLFIIFTTSTIFMKLWDQISNPSKNNQNCSVKTSLVISHKSLDLLIMDTESLFSNRSCPQVYYPCETRYLSGHLISGFCQKFEQIMSQRMKRTEIYGKLDFQSFIILCSKAFRSVTDSDINGQKNDEIKKAWNNYFLLIENWQKNSHSGNLELYYKSNIISDLPNFVPQISKSVRYRINNDIFGSKICQQDDQDVVQEKSSIFSDFSDSEDDDGKVADDNFFGMYQPTANSGIICHCCKEETRLVSSKMILPNNCGNCGLIFN